MNELKQETFIDKQELADFMLTQHQLSLYPKPRIAHTKLAYHDSTKRAMRVL